MNNPPSHPKLLLHPPPTAQVRNAADDTAAVLADKAPGRDTQDPAQVERSGANPGFEAARDMAEKVEDA